MLPYTLGNSEFPNPFITNPELRLHGQDRSWVDTAVPLGGPYNRVGVDFNGWSNDNIDVRPPGVREQMPDPSRPQFLPTRSNLFQRNDTSVNNAPILNYQEKLPALVASPWAQRYGSEMHDVLRETPVKEHWLFRDFGQFNVPYTGFTALKDIRPASTLGDSLGPSRMAH